MNSLDVDQCIGLSAISITSLIAGYFTDTVKNIGKTIADSDNTKWLSFPRLYASIMTFMALVAAVGVLFLVIAIEDGRSTGWGSQFIRISVALSVGFLTSSVAGAATLATQAARETKVATDERISAKELTELTLRMQTLQGEISMAQLQLRRDQLQLDRERRLAEQDRRIRRARFVLDLPGVRRFLRTFPITRSWATEVLIPAPLGDRSQPDRPGQQST